MTDKAQPGCTLAQYSEAKHLPVDFLKSLGLKDREYMGVTALRIPYPDAQGLENAVRFRIALKGKNHFRWRKGSKLSLYTNTSLTTPGIATVLVEGESDCHTLWYHGICAYGLPGAGNWKEEYSILIEQHDVIYVLIEPDSGGEAVLKWLARSAIRHKAKLVKLAGFKDPSDMHIADPEQFKERWQQALDSAVAFSDWEREQPKQEPASLFDELMSIAESLCEGEHDEASALLGEAADLSVLQRRTLYNAIKERTGFTLGDLRNATAEIHGTEIRDHLVLAREAIDDTGKENLLSTVAHVWLWHTCGIWRAIDDRKLKQLVQHTLERKGHEVMRNLIDGVADVLKTEIFAQEHEWNLHSDAISFLNGELHWIDEKWELQPHCREHYRTTQIPHNYDPNAQCPRFLQFLKEIFSGDSDGKEKATLIIELLGYTLVSNARLEKFILLIGSGANGKSVLLDVIRVMVGTENIAAVQPSQFSNRFQRAHLHLKLANLVTEIAEGAEIADAELKAIVSGEINTAEHKFGHPFNFRPFCTCWFGTNHMPHTRDFSNALFRRAIVIQFNRVFKEGEDANAQPKDKADPHLKDKLAEEMPGIINLALQAFGAMLKRGKFTEPKSCTEAKQEWRIEADQVAQFIGDMLDADANAQVTSRELYGYYKTWADNAGVIRKLNRKNFTTRIMRLGGTPCKGTAGKRMIAGFKLKSVLEQE